MSTTGAIAVYFIIWWLCLFVVLPFGVRNAHETGGAVGEGHEAGAPINPMLWRKALATTILAALVFALVYGAPLPVWVGRPRIVRLLKTPTSLKALRWSSGALSGPKRPENTSAHSWASRWPRKKCSPQKWRSEWA